jgi:hypothetical protein
MPMRRNWANFRISGLVDREIVPTAYAKRTKDMESKCVKSKRMGEGTFHEAR